MGRLHSTGVVKHMRGSSQSAPEHSLSLGKPLMVNNFKKCDPPYTWSQTGGGHGFILESPIYLYTLPSVCLMCVCVGCLHLYISPPAKFHSPVLHQRYIESGIFQQISEPQYCIRDIKKYVCKQKTKPLKNFKRKNVFLKKSLQL